MYSIKVSYWNGHLTITTRKLRAGEINLAPIETPNEALIIKNTSQLRIKLKSLFSQLNGQLRKNVGRVRQWGQLKSAPGDAFCWGDLKNGSFIQWSRSSTHGLAQSSTYITDTQHLYQQSLLWINLAPISQLCTSIGTFYKVKSVDTIIIFIESKESYLLYFTKDLILMFHHKKNI